MAEIKDDASFKAWVEGAEEKLAQVGDLSAIKTTVDLLKTDMDKMAADLGRRQLPIDGAENKRLPVSAEDFKAFGLKAVLAAPVTAKRNSYDGTYAAEGEDDRIVKFHETNDRLILLSQVVDNGKHKNNVRALKYYHSHFVPALTKVLAGLDTSTSGELSQFDPTEYSNSLYEKVRLARLLPNLFNRVSVPRFPFVLPTFPNDGIASKWAENTAGSSTLIADGNPTPTALSGSVTLTGASLAMQLAWSWELDEDSIIPMLPFLEMVVVNAIGNGQETALINGDTTATHQDTDTAAAASTVAAKLWKGLRFYALSGTAKLAASGNKINTDALWRDYVAQVRGLMGKHGVNSGELALIASPIGINQIRSCESFRTLYAFGSQATNTSGGVPRPNGSFSPDGFDVVVSEFQREDLAATGVNTAPSDAKTALILVNKGAYLFAETRAIRTQVLNEVYAINGQKGLLASWRGDFAPIFAPASNPHTGIVYDIATA